MTKTFQLLIIGTVCILAAGAAIWFIRRPTSRVDVSRPSVIKEIRSMQKLETASFTIEKVIEAGTQGNTFQDFLYGDRVLLIAHGTVVAGFDLENLDAANISSSGSTLKLALPEPEIFSTTLDNSQTKVFDRKLGILNKGDRNLESEARAAAESSIRKAACDAGILDNATKNAKEQLGKTLGLLGYTSIEVTALQGNCAS